MFLCHHWIRKKIRPQIYYTLAWGFRVDFSEDNEPTDELGDKPGPLETETVPTQSEFEDAELTGGPWEFIGWTSPTPLADGVTSKGSAELVFSQVFEETLDEEA